LIRAEVGALGYSQIQKRRRDDDARGLDQDRQGNRNRRQIKRRWLWIASGTQKKIQPDDSQAERRHIGHERATGKDVQRRKGVEKRSPNRRHAVEDFAHEQKEKWERNSEEDYGLAAPDPFVNAGEFVTNRRKEWQNGKFCSHVTG
jgi:hypothetical protein